MLRYVASTRLAYSPEPRSVRVQIGEDRAQIVRVLYHLRAVAVLKCQLELHLLRVGPLAAAALHNAGTKRIVSPSKGKWTDHLRRRLLPRIALLAARESLRRLYTPSRLLIQATRPSHIARIRRVHFARSDVPRPAVNMPVSRQEFETVFPRLVEDLKEHCAKYKLPEQATKWFQQVGQP